MYSSTIHGFCFDLLQRYVFRYLKYDVFNDVRQRLLIDRNFQKSGMGALGLRRYLDSGLYIRILSTLREAEADADVLHGHTTQLALDKYQSQLDSHRYFDYDEIMPRALTELIANKQRRRQVADRVKYVTVDECRRPREVCDGGRVSRCQPHSRLLVRQLYDLGAPASGNDEPERWAWVRS